MSEPVGDPLRVVSGIRATGRMHLGNYLGAIKRFVEIAGTGGAGFFFVADLHTLSTTHDPDALAQGLPELVLDCLAAGVDPEHTTVYVQSSVPATSELAWLLASAAFVGELEGTPAFRERARGGVERLHAGLLNYPLLMAADILGPRAQLVALGEDQYPHLELARDIARRFNVRAAARGARALPVPESAETSPVRVPGLDGLGKMGKSQGSALGLAESAEERREKLAAAATDPGRRQPADRGVPERCTVFALHELASDADARETIAEGCRAGALACGECKGRLDVALTALLEPIRARRSALAARSGLVREVLGEGARTARALVAETRDRVQDCLGVIRY